MDLGQAKAGVWFTFMHCSIILLPTKGSTSSHPFIDFHRKSFPADVRFPSHCRAALCIIGLSVVIASHHFPMQNMLHSRRALVSLAGKSFAALGFLLSLALAMTLLVRQGNPGILLVWLAATVGTIMCLRVHSRWRKSVERMGAPDAIRPFLPAREGWRQNVEDVVFHELPDAAAPSRQ